MLSSDDYNIVKQANKVPFRELFFNMYSTKRKLARVTIASFGNVAFTKNRQREHHLSVIMKLISSLDDI